MSILLLSLPLTLLVVAAVGLLAVADVAFPKSTVSVGRRGTAARWFAAARTNSLELACPETPFIPRVTRMEAETIASTIRRRGAEAVAEVVARVEENSGGCPLRDAQGWCACAMSRPLECVGRCFIGADSPEWVEGIGTALSATLRRHLSANQLDAELLPLPEALRVELGGAASRPVTSRS